MINLICRKHLGLLVLQVICFKKTPLIEQTDLAKQLCSAPLVSRFGRDPVGSSTAWPLTKLQHNPEFRIREATAWALLTGVFCKTLKDLILYEIMSKNQKLISRKDWADIHKPDSHIIIPLFCLFYNLIFRKEVIVWCTCCSSCR